MRRILRPQVFSEIAEASHWYEAQEPGLGARFLDHLEQALERIGENPYLYQEVDLEIRRARMHPFPYGIFYSVIEDTVQVLGVIDDRRDPEIRKRKLRSR